MFGIGTGGDGTAVGCTRCGRCDECMSVGNEFDLSLCYLSRALAYVQRGDLLRLRHLTPLRLHLRLLLLHLQLLLLLL